MKINWTLWVYKGCFYEEGEDIALDCTLVCDSISAWHVHYRANHHHLLLSTSTGIVYSLIWGRGIHKRRLKACFLCRPCRLVATSRTNESQTVSWPQSLNMDLLATKIKQAGSAVKPQLWVSTFFVGMKWTEQKSNPNMTAVFYSSLKVYM